jgi:putative FmdB family regulatory protein
VDILASMPIYEFVCEACGNIVERLQKLSDPPPDSCPECGGKMAKIMSRNSFQLKGGGWYRDLYGSSSSKTANQSTDAKPADKDAAKKDDGAKPAAAPAAAPKETAAPAPAPKKDAT